MKQINKSALKVFLCFLVFFLCHDLRAQLSPFTINVTSSPQTCLGNGSLNFTVAGATTGAAMEFEVYLLPNITQPVTTVTTLSATGLVAGDYKVVATQTLNGQSNSATANATIADNTVPFSYTANVVNVNCQQEGSITVVVTSGTASAYEIISGPETFPQQTSNVFSGLQAGQYQVRVYNDCGDAFVTDVMVTQQAPQILFSTVNSFEGALPSCSTISINYSFYTLANDAGIAFPITIKYKIYPPGGGAPVIIDDAMATGNSSNYVLKEIPFYYGQLYHFTIEITDACGNTFISPDNQVYKQLELSLSKSSPGCNAFFLHLGINNYVLPYTVNFISSPTGFNPSQFNTSHPVINEQMTTYGTTDNPVPSGTYVIQITDACGHTVQDTIILGEGGVPQVNTAQGADCFQIIGITVPNSRTIASATLVAAPQSFGSVPQDMMPFASGPILVLTGATPGHYTFQIKDICGNEYLVEVDVISNADSALYLQQAQGCTPGFGSVMIYASGGELTFFKITNAPPAFTEALPADVSENILFGGFFMNSLPGGTYVFEGIDQCGNIRAGSYEVKAYVEEAVPAEVIYNCGSFNIDLHNGDFTDGFSSYLLQVFDEVSGQWVDPQSGFPGSGIWLQNNEITYNLTYTGDFRIIKNGMYYINGADYDENGGGGYAEYCTREIFTFTFTGAPVIEGAYAFPCSNGLSEVIIDAEGVPPLEYAITQKNGQPYVVNNGPNMVFTALENAVYNFRVTDECGNIVNIQYDITNLKPLAIEQDGFCGGEASSLYVKQYTFLTYEWWREGDPDTILSTTNKLDFTSFSPDQMGVYYLKIVSTTPGSCIDMVLQHAIELPHAANAGSDTIILHCDLTNTVNLNDYLSEDHTTGGIWKDKANTGLLSGSIFTVGQVVPGIYEFSYTVSQCGISDEAIVTIDVKGNDVFPIAITAGCVDFKFILNIANISDIQGAIITWTGPDNFTSELPVIDITGGTPGEYMVTVTNAEGCIAEASVMVPETSCELPKGVSPNGDGLNDYFDLSLMDIEKIEIFNRYGLIIYEAANYKKEWCGQTDGEKEVPTGTYYYVIKLSTGKQITGWVYLQREK
jgi:gliding motility-associated-like protein